MIFAKVNTTHQFPMPRTAFYLLISCVLLSVTPHVSRIPLWMSVAFVIIVLWRILIFRERLQFPARWLRLVLVLTAFIAVIVNYGTIFGPNAGVGLLITAYLFKLLEMYTKRDAFLVIVLSYFVLATEFLFLRSLWISIYVFCVLIIITSTLTAINQSDPALPIWKPVKTALGYVVQAVPLMLVFFYFFPRIGPIWQLSLTTKINTVGLSESIAPGDISNLARSKNLAFRAEFDGLIPRASERYWRAMVFDRYDGKTWYAAKPSDNIIVNSRYAQTEKRSYQYRIYLEPTGQRWLMGIPLARISGVNNLPLSDLTIYTKDEIDKPVKYEVTSYPDFAYQTSSLTRSEWYRYTRLPSQGNRRSLDFVQQHYPKARSNPEKFSQALMAYFNKNPFYYTLSPPRLGSDAIDEFLFETRKGFCAHYAGAYVYLLRLAGIPSRMIGGYQGGAMHPIGNYLLVHQYDAHAWAEYWVEGKGWVRVDPTAAVAPERILEGARGGTTDASFLSESPLSPNRLRNMQVFARIRLMADYVDYLWFKNVVSFGEEEQRDLLQEWLGKVTPERIAFFFIVLASLVIACLTIFLLLGRRQITRLDKVDKLYLIFCTKLSKAGYVRELSEGPETFAKRVSEQLPEKADEIRAIADLYQNIQYALNNNSTVLGLQQQSVMNEFTFQLKQAVHKFHTKK